MTSDATKTAGDGRKLTPFVAIFLFGIILYGNTAFFGFTLDDKLYITANEYTKQGIEGIGEIWTNDMMVGFFGKKKNLVEGGRYRPLALTTHAIEWELFGKNATIAHVVNILLHALMGVILLKVLLQLFETKASKKWWWTLPFVATLIFLSHPTHTEVGANIKSRDEIMSLLFALLSFYSVLRYLKASDMKHLVLSGVWFWLSLASKESTITFLGVIPLTLIFFPKGTWKKSALAIGPILIATAAYFALRLSVLGAEGNSLEVAKELMNQPYLNASDDERLASIFFTMALYLKLLFWPHPLTHDYYPFHPFATYDELVNGASGYVDWSSPVAIFGLVSYTAILGFGLYTLVSRLKGKKANMIGYGALLFIGTFILFSNLFFDIGAFMNERFLFIPTLGYAIPVAWLLVEKLGKKEGLNTGVLITAVLILGYSVKTMYRNNAWESDRTLAAVDVGTSDGSAKIKMTMGSELLDQAKEPKNTSKKQQLLKQAEQYELQSLKIYPTYFPPLDILGNIYFEQGNYEYSVHYFKQALKLKPQDPRMRNNMEAVANMAKSKGQFEPAIKGYKALARLLKGEDQSRIYSSLGELYGKDMNDLMNSKKYLELAKKADPTNSGAYQKLGIVHAMTGNADSAMFNFTKAYELDPENARVLLNLGLLNQQLGNIELGNEYVRRAQEIDPTVMGGE
ncbi:MAG: hypothetical protein Salg2KO_00090 [Salibacteraceae bacterium]